MVSFNVIHAGDLIKRDSVADYDDVDEAYYLAESVLSDADEMLSRYDEATHSEAERRNLNGLFKFTEQFLIPSYKQA